MNPDDVLLTSLGDFSADELDDIAHDAQHSKRVRIAAMLELAGRTGEADIAKDVAWQRIVHGRSKYAERARTRESRRAALRDEAAKIARRISELWQTAVYGDEWDSAVDAYSEILRLRDRENEIDVQLGNKKRRIPVDASRNAAEAALRDLRTQKAAEADALDHRQRTWSAEEDRRDRADRLPRRRPAYMDDQVRRPPPGPEGRNSNEHEPDVSSRRP